MPCFTEQHHISLLQVCHTTPDIVHVHISIVWWLVTDIKRKYYFKFNTLREGGVKCQFSACTPDSFEKNAVKIVQVKLGYVHVVCKLKTSSSVCCILVCEPNYLLVAEETGRMNLWTMNSTWRYVSLYEYFRPSLQIEIQIPIYEWFAYFYFLLLQCSNRTQLFSNIWFC